MTTKIEKPKSSLSAKIDSNRTHISQMQDNVSAAVSEKKRNLIKTSRELKLALQRKKMLPWCKTTSGFKIQDWSDERDMNAAIA